MCSCGLPPAKLIRRGGTADCLLLTDRNDPRIDFRNVSNYFVGALVQIMPATSRQELQMQSLFK
jgi:hypothetical protein